MSSSTSSRSTLTMVPSTMSPSLKYLMVASIAARKSSSEPMSLTAICGVSGRVEELVMWKLVPRMDRESYGRAGSPVSLPWLVAADAPWRDRRDHRGDSERESAPYETQADDCAPLRIRNDPGRSPTAPGSAGQ